MTALAVHPNGDTGSHDKTVRFWSAEGEKKGVLKEHTGGVMAVAIHPNGDTVTGSQDNTAIIWNAGE